MPCFRRLDRGLSPHRSGFEPSSVHVRLVVDKWNWDFGFPFQRHSINAPDSSSYTCRSYQKDKGAKRRNLLKNNGLWKIGAHWIEKYFHSGFWRLKGRFLRRVTACIYVKYAWGPVFFVGTTSWRRKDQQDETWRCRCTNESVLRFPLENSICQKLTTVQYNPLKCVSISSFSYHNTVAHCVNLRHLAAGWRRGRSSDEEAEMKYKKANLQVCNQVVTQRVIRFQL